MEALIVIVVAYFVVKWLLNNSKQKEHLKAENDALKENIRHRDYFDN